MWFRLDSGAFGAESGVLRCSPFRRSKAIPSLRIKRTNCKVLAEGDVPIDIATAAGCQTTPPLVAVRERQMTSNGLGLQERTDFEDRSSTCHDLPFLLMTDCFCSHPQTRLFPGLHLVITFGASPPLCTHVICIWFKKLICEESFVTNLSSLKELWDYGSKPQGHIANMSIVSEAPCKEYRSLLCLCEENQQVPKVIVRQISNAVPKVSFCVMLSASLFLFGHPCSTATGIAELFERNFRIACSSNFHT